MALKNKTRKHRKASTVGGRGTGKTEFVGNRGKKEFAKAAAKEKLPQRIIEYRELLNTPIGDVYKKLVDTSVSRYDATKQPVPPHTKDITALRKKFYFNLEKSRKQKGNPLCLNLLKLLNTPAFRKELFQDKHFHTRLYSLWKSNNYQWDIKFTPTQKMLHQMFRQWFTEATSLPATDKNVEFYLWYKNTIGIFTTMCLALGALVAGYGLYALLKKGGWNFSGTNKDTAPNYSPEPSVFSKQP